MEIHKDWQYPLDADKYKISIVYLSTFMRILHSLNLYSGEDPWVL